jgi:hypothetical protein
VLLRLQARHGAALALGVGTAKGIEDVRHRGGPASISAARRRRGAARRCR